VEMSRKSEVGSRKSEDRNQKTDNGLVFLISDF
jgi:hypothetical protein